MGVEEGLEEEEVVEECEWLGARPGVKTTPHTCIRVIISSNADSA